MKKTRIQRVVSVLLIAAITLFPVATGDAKVNPTSVEEAREGNVLIGVDGEFQTGQLGAAIRRINQIRQEAYEEGLVSTYIPIQLSAQLERIAQIRAAEASLNISHTRPNGRSCFTIASGGISSTGEVLAWNWSKNGMVDGINRWYAEKYDYVNNTGGETGHYTSMIDPSNRFVGLGCFYTSSGVQYPTTVAGEFSYDDNNTPITETANASGQVTQLIEVPRGSVSVSNPADIRTSPGKTMVFGLPAKYDSRVSATIMNLSWSSTDPSVASVSDNMFRCDGVGPCTLCTEFAGNTYSVRVRFANPMNAKGKTLTFKSKKKKAGPFYAGNAIDVSGAVGTVTYKKTSGSSKVTVNRSTGSITIKKGIKKNKTYKIRIAVTASGDDVYDAGSQTAVVKIRVTG